MKILTAALFVAFAPNLLAQELHPLVGTWAVVSADSIDSSGARKPVYGDNPRGQLILAPNGRYAQTIMRPSLPKFASGVRTSATPEEQAALVNGSNTHFGRYTVDDTRKTLTFHIEASTFPNWDGVTQVRGYRLQGDQLIYTVEQASAGGRGEVTLKRIR